MSVGLPFKEAQKKADEVRRLLEGKLGPIDFKKLQDSLKECLTTPPDPVKVEAARKLLEEGLKSIGVKIPFEK